MEKRKLEITYSLYQQAAELSSDEISLLEAALEATDRAYAPFSGFRVGCAVLLRDGSIITGNNQENRAYPSGICAERTALFHIGSIGKGNQIEKIAIRARSDKKQIIVPAMPCGGCRQVMVEYEQITGKPFIILSQGVSGEILRMEGVQDSLMPFSFDIEF
ncbi:MAG: cytidine deaminase [Bacteroidia bacterium]|nr:cytidine deaminase [Bacteroidia bacterium]